MARISFFNDNTIEDLIKEIQYETTKNVLRIKTGFMTDKGHGVFTQRLTSDTDQLADHFDSLLASSTELFRVISLLIAFFVISPIMFVFEAIVFGIYCIIQIFLLFLLEME